MLNLRFMCTYTDWPVGGSVLGWWKKLSTRIQCNFLYILGFSMKQAYKNHVAVHGPDPPLPGIDLSHDQLFFVNFAQVDWLMSQHGWMEGWMDGKDQCLVTCVAVWANLTHSFQVWCSKTRPEHVLSSVNSDTHSQSIFRWILSNTLLGYEHFPLTHIGPSITSSCPAESWDPSRTSRNLLRPSNAKTAATCLPRHGALCGDVRASSTGTVLWWSITSSPSVSTLQTFWGGD